MSKKIKVLAIVLIVTLLGWIIYNTYSKYINEAQAVITKRIGQWVIKVNNTDITAIHGDAIEDHSIDMSDPVDFTIPTSDMVWYENSTKTTIANRLQPGGCGYFSILIDPRGTETSVQYTITIDQTEMLEIGHGIAISGIKVGNTSLTIDDLTADEVNATGIIPLSDIENGRTDDVHVEITWTNDNNRDDSNLSGVFFFLPVSVNVIQYTGT